MNYVRAREHAAESSTLLGVNMEFEMCDYETAFKRFQGKSSAGFKEITSWGEYAVVL